MLYAIVAAIILIADQWLKYFVTVNITLATGAKELIPGLVSLVNIHNTGAAFGFMSNAAIARWLFVGLSVAFAVFVIIVLAKDLFHSRFANWCAVIALAGALGNCIDRLLYGYVVDMFKLEFVNFAIFNVADIILVVACILFIIFILFGGKDKEKDVEEDEDYDYFSAPVSDENIAVSEVRSEEASETPAPVVPDDEVQPVEEEKPAAEVVPEPAPVVEDDFSLEDILNEFK